MNAASIPSFATGPALILVGALMMVSPLALIPCFYCVCEVSLLPIPCSQTAHQSVLIRLRSSQIHRSEIVLSIWLSTTYCLACSSAPLWADQGQTAILLLPCRQSLQFALQANAAKVDWRDITQAVPSFLTIIIMPLTYSIAYGGSNHLNTLRLLSALCAVPSEV